MVGIKGKKEQERKLMEEEEMEDYGLNTVNLEKRDSRGNGRTGEKGKKIKLRRGKKKEKDGKGKDRTENETKGKVTMV